MHKAAAAGFTITVGNGLTKIDTVAELVQLFADVPVTVYTVLLEGLAVGLGQDEQLSPDAGNQLYVLAPDTDIGTTFPAQIVAEPGEADNTGSELTVTRTVCVFVHPLTSVPVVVYVVVTVGFTEVLAQLLQEAVADGVHT